jgi:hypothetical protein
MAEQVVDEKTPPKAVVQMTHSNYLNYVESSVELSVKLFNCMADAKLFQKSCVVLENIDSAR